MRAPGRSSRAVLAMLASTAAFGLAHAASDGRLLLRDDFDGTGLDAARWIVPSGAGTFFGRTQIRPPAEPPTVAAGTLRLRLDTYNPTAEEPADSFQGSEIDSTESFPVKSGLALRARARLVAPVPAGVVGSLFAYALLPDNTARDEIDFELLGNDVVAGNERVLSNVFDDDDFAQPGDKAFVTVAGLDPSEFHVYEIRWSRDRVRWFVDGNEVREETATVPGESMNVRLNFWAPGDGFAEAYDASLQPVAAAEDNESYYYEVDFVEVRRLPPLLSPLLDLLSD